MKRKAIIMIIAGVIALAVGVYLVYAGGAYSWPFTTGADYNISDSANVEISGDGYAQLVKQTTIYNDDTVAEYDYDSGSGHSKTAAVLGGNHIGLSKMPNGEYNYYGIYTSEVESKSSGTWVQISWTESLPSNTDIKFQVRSDNSSSDTSGWSSVFSGPIGTGDFYTTAVGETLTSSISGSFDNSDQYIQYRVYLETSDGVSTPQLSVVDISGTADSSLPDDTRVEFDAGIYSNTVWYGDELRLSFDTMGTGADGELTVSSAGTVVNTYVSIVDRTISAGATTINVKSAQGRLFSDGDEVLVIQMQHLSNAGTYERAVVSSAAANSITLSAGLDNIYYSNRALIRSQIVRVPNYTDVTIDIGASIVADSWDGGKGGIVMFRASGTVTVNGSIDVTAQGFLGGRGRAGGDSIYSSGGNGDGELSGGGGGGSGGGSGSGNSSGAGGNSGGGGGGGGRHYPPQKVGASGGGASGGGAGYGSVGKGGQRGPRSEGNSRDGNDGSGFYGGNGGRGDVETAGGGGGGGMYGSADLSKIYLGSGGGGEGTDPTSNSNHISGRGGNGGGIIYVAAENLVVSGAISSNGENGVEFSADGNSGGGGGSGGSIYLISREHQLSTNKVTSTGGTGYYSKGAGGVGRIRVDYTEEDNSSQGSTNPAAYSGTIAETFPSSGTFTSRIFNPGTEVNWEQLSWVEEAPYGDALSVGSTGTALAGDEPGLKGLWHMDDADSGAVDSSGNSITLDEGGTLQFRQVGKLPAVPYGIIFTDGDSLSTADDDDLDMGTGDFTIEVWIKTAEADSVSDMKIVEKSDSDTGVGYYFEIGADDYLEAFIDDRNSDANVTISGDVDVADQSWHHVAFVADRDGDGRLYVDGAEDTSAAVSIAGESLDISNDGTFYIGNNSEGTEGFEGTLDEAAIYSRALSGAEIKQHYMDQIGLVGLVGLWHLDESSRLTMITDSTGNKDGKYNGSLQNQSPAMFNTGIGFDGRDDVITVGDIEQQVKTVEFWINDSNTADGILELTDDAYISISGSAITATGYTSPTIYVNGSSSSAALSNGWNYVAVVTDTAVSADAVYIGKADDNYLDGTLDEVAFWERRLSASEILAHYRAGIADIKLQVSVDGGRTWTNEDGDSGGYITSSPAALTDITDDSIQYRAEFSTIDSSYTPKLHGVMLSNFVYSADTDDCYVTNTAINAVDYQTTPGSIESFSDDGVTGVVRYRFSPDGTNWYYHNGSAWTVTSEVYSISTTNLSSDLTDEVMQAFDEEAGKGTAFSFKAYLVSTGLTQVSVDSVGVTTVDDTLSAVTIDAADSSGAVLSIGAEYTIGWLSAGYITNVKIEYQDGSGSWQDIVSSTANGGSYSWIVPACSPTASALIRISDVTDAANVTVTSSAFTIQGAALTGVDVVPYGYNSSGTPFAQKGDAVVNFTLAQDLPTDGKIKIDFPTGFDLTSVSVGDSVASNSIDGGLSVTSKSVSTVIVSRDSTGNAVSGTTAADMTLSNVKNPSEFGSTGAYTVTTYSDSINVLDAGTDTGDTVVGFNFSSPTSSTQWAVGSANNMISWSEQGVSTSDDSKHIEYSYDGSSDWGTIQIVSPNTSSYSWDISGEAEIGNNNRIRITDAGADNSLVESDDNIVCISDAFAITGGITVEAPNGSEKWALGSTQTITWETTGELNRGVMIYYSTGSAESDSWKLLKEGGTLNNGVTGETLQWDIADDLSAGSDTVWIKIKDADSSHRPIAEDVSDASFKIGSISVNELTLSNRGGESEGSVQETATQAIAWGYAGVDNVKIEYYSHDDAGWRTAMDADNSNARAESVASDGAFNWYVEDDVHKADADGVFIKISAVDSEYTGSNALSSQTSTAFTVYGLLSATAPRGGTYKVDNFEYRVPFIWEGSTSIESVEFEYSTDTINWTSIVARRLYPTASGNTDGDNFAAGGSTLYWQPGSVGRQVWYRVKDVNDSFTVSSAAGDFAISGVGITEPAENSTFTVGSDVTIAGTATVRDAQNVRLYYSSTGQAGTYVEMKDGNRRNLTPAVADGGYSGAWRVPDVIGSNVYIKVEGFSDSDVSNVKGPYIVRSGLTLNALSNPLIVGSTIDTVSGTYTGTVSKMTLKYSTDGSTWIALKDSSGADLTAFSVSGGTFSKTITVPDTISASFRVKAYDATVGRNVELLAESAATAAVNLKGKLAFTSPAVSATWFAGYRNPTVAWDATGSMGNVKFSYTYSTDWTNGRSWNGTYQDLTLNGNAAVASGGSGTSAVSTTYGGSSGNSFTVPDILATQAASDLEGSSSDLEKYNYINDNNKPQNYLKLRIESVRDSTVYAEVILPIRYYTIYWNVTNLNTTAVIDDISISADSYFQESGLSHTTYADIGGISGDTAAIKRYYPYIFGTTSTWSDNRTDYRYISGSQAWGIDTAYDDTQGQLVEMRLQHKDLASSEYVVAVDVEYVDRADAFGVTVWMTERGSQVAGIDYRQNDGLKLFISDSSGTDMLVSYTGAVLDSSGSGTSENPTHGRYYISDAWRPANVLGTFNISWDPSGGIDPSMVYTLKAKVKYKGADYYGVSTFTIPAVGTYGVQIQPFYDSDNDAIVANVWLERSGNVITDVSDESLDYRIHDGGRNLTPTTNLASRASSSSAGIYYNISSQPTVSELTPNKIYTLSAGIAYRNSTYTGTYAFTIPAVGTYEVSIQPNYNSVNDSINTRIWIERSGSIVEDVGSSGLTSLTFSDGTAVTSNLYASASYDSNYGVFKYEWDPSGGLSADKIYIIKASASYRNKTYTAVRIFSPAAYKQTAALSSEIGIVGSKVDTVGTDVGLARSAAGAAQTAAEAASTAAEAASTAASAAETAAAATSSVIGDSTSTASTTVFGKLSGLSSVIGTTSDTGAASTVFGKMSSVRSDVSSMQTKIASGVINQETVAKIGGTIPIKYKDTSGQSPVIDVYNGSNSKVVSNALMKEIGETGIYSYSLALQSSWGTGDYTIITSNASTGKVDSMVLSVLSTSLEDIAADTSYIYTLSGAASKADINAVSAKVDVLGGDINSVIVKLGALSSKAGAGGKSALNTTEIYSQLSSIKAELSSINKERNVGFDAMKLYDLSRESSSDLHYIKNKTLELKAMIEMNKKIIESQLNKPVIKTWFENGR